MNLNSAGAVLGQQSGMPALRPASVPATGPAAIAKLRKAAAEFEATLLSSWWSSMKQGGLSSGEDDTDPGKDTLDQLGMQAMSAAVANGRGGLGIGDMLVRSLLSNHPEIAGAAPQSGKIVAGKRGRDTGKIE
jgi:Rod binding domain-containing protein